MKIEDKELIETEGGGISFGIAACIIGGIIFLIGVIDGMVNYKACRR